jgi:hypothetical protein
MTLEVNLCISTIKENEFVRRLAKDHLVWLGGTDEFEEGKWTWDNGDHSNLNIGRKINHPEQTDLISLF